MTDSWVKAAEEFWTPAMVARVQEAVAPISPAIVPLEFVRLVGNWCEAICKDLPEGSRPKSDTPIWMYAHVLRQFREAAREILEANGVIQSEGVA